MSEPSGTRVIKLQDNETMKFLELYAAERSLYDASRKEYKDRDIRKAAVTRISEAMAIPGFGPKEVCAKFKNLRSSYCQELKKIADSERSGSGTDGVYVPKVVWFETMNSFIRPFVQQRPTKSNLVIGTNLSCAISPEEPTEPENYVDRIHDSISIEVQPNNSVETTPKTSGNKRKAPSQPSSNSIVKKTYDPEADCMYGKIEKLNEISSRASQSPKEDSYDYFGKYVASMLRNIGLPTAMRLQEKMMRLLTEAICPPPPHSPWGQSTSYNFSSYQPTSNSAATNISDELSD